MPIHSRLENPPTPGSHDPHASANWPVTKMPSRLRKKGKNTSNQMGDDRLGEVTFRNKVGFDYLERRSKNARDSFAPL
jgi:hypothetical protein